MAFYHETMTKNAINLNVLNTVNSQMAIKAHASLRYVKWINPLLKAIAFGLTVGKMSPANIEKVMKRLQGFFKTAVALATTAISIYIGLMGIIGS